MQRYFVNSKENNIIIINKEDSHHIKNVMRMSLYDKVELIYENTIYIGEIIELSDNVKCKIIEEKENKEDKTPKVIIAQALVKEQKMDYILQKACELGLFELIPINTERSVVKLDKKDNKKITRWCKILKEASEQSKRVNIPKIDKILDLKELKEIKADYKFICSVKENTKTIKSVLSNINISDTIIFVIGPEGGLSEKEENLLETYGYKRVSFGHNVLRTETASLFVLSAINYEFMG
ncbi:MAG: 16S rRNA (uracil(1498)-N(3))-methyltransferase [Bacilli bacterium]|nr:16S rRNA (uracil(1498)-N(3))-methyltransferase [Bacilli bacterium]